MGDMAEVFREMTKYKKEKRRNRLLANTEKLKAANINFEPKNNGIHIIISHNGKTIDFYPSNLPHLLGEKGKRAMGKQRMGGQL